MWIQITTWGTTNNVITTNLLFESHLFFIVDNIGFGTQFYLVEGWKSEKNINYFIYFCFPPCVFGKEDGKSARDREYYSYAFINRSRMVEKFGCYFFFLNLKEKKNGLKLKVPSILIFFLFHVYSNKIMESHFFFLFLFIFILSLWAFSP